MKIETSNLKTVERGFPIIAAGVYTAQVEVEIKESKTLDDFGNPKNNLVVTATILDEELPKKDGTMMKNNGMKLNSYIGLTLTEKYTQDILDARVADLVAAVAESDDDMMEEMDTEVFNDTARYCKIQIIVDPAKNGGLERNSIKRFIRLTDEERAEMA